MSSPAPARIVRRPFEVHAAPVVWTTPALLRLGAYAVVGASLLFMIAVITGARSHRQAMQSIGRDAAPSIIAAQHIRSAMADMDSYAAQQLLSPGSDDVVHQFEASRQEAVNAMMSAAENITYGDAERLPLQKLAFGIGSYEAHAQLANDLRSAKDKRFISAYRSAAKIMDDQLLPAAADLDKANRDVLDDTYARQRSFASASLLFLLLSALLLCGVLLTLQWFLAGRMRRVLNPLLAFATAIAMLFTVYTANAFRAEDHELKVAKEEAFDSIHALWQARALAYAARADESRSFLDPEQADADEKSFFEKADRIAHVPSGKDGADATSGFLADELNNITFPGEREAARNASYWFNRYRRSAFGGAASDERECFNKFDEHLGKTLLVNQTAFNQAVDRGFNDVSGFETSAPIAALLIAALAYFGLLPRMREYSA